MASACKVETEWLSRRLDEGFFPHAENAAGMWRFSGACLIRARRMRDIELNFDAVPELAALVADLPEEMDDLRRRLDAR
ncbi:MAG: MerR family transcriptional regulator [Candidatus Accumulibacter sp.]|nr:MerR family transcriptional regulator [Accumulibacter sp.]